MYTLARIYLDRQSCDLVGNVCDYVCEIEKTTLTVSAISSETKMSGVAVFEWSLRRHNTDKLLPAKPNRQSSPMSTASIIKSYVMHAAYIVLSSLSAVAVALLASAAASPAVAPCPHCLLATVSLAIVLT